MDTRNILHIDLLKFSDSQLLEIDNILRITDTKEKPYSLITARKEGLTKIWFNQFGILVAFMTNSNDKASTKNITVGKYGFAYKGLYVFTSLTMKERKTLVKMKPIDISFIEEYDNKLFLSPEYDNTVKNYDFTGLNTDSILDKINESGIGSLTSKENAFLKTLKK